MKRWSVLVICAAAIACDPLMPLRVMDEVQPVESVQLAVESYSEGLGYLRSGAFATIRAQMFDVNDNEIEATGKTVTWSSTTPDIVEVAPIAADPGLVALTGRKKGSTVLTATVDGKSAEMVVTVSPGSPDRLIGVSGTGQTGIAGEPFPTPFVVEVRDAFGNALGAGISVQFIPSTGTITGGSTQSTDASGQVSTTWTPSSSGAHTLTVRVSSSLSGAFTATVTTLALGITTQPATTTNNGQAMSPAPVVQLRYASSGGAYARAGLLVTATLTGNTTVMTLTGNTATTNASGAATFPNLVVSGVEGLVTLRFSTSSPSATVLAGAATELRGGVPTKLAIITQPPVTAVSGRVLSLAPVVQLQDANSNASPQAGVTVTATTSSGTLAGAQATTDANGRATFSQLAVTGTPGGSYQLTFTVPSSTITSVTAFSRTLTGPEVSLAIATSPSMAPCNAPLQTPPAVQLRDAGGRDVSQAGVAVTASFPSGVTTASVHAGATATTDANGIARFTSMELRGTASTQSLTFASGTLTGTSTSVTLIAGASHALAMVQQPGATAQNGIAMSPQPQVRLVDVCGNNVTSASASITAATTVGDVSFLNGTRVTTSGVATFSSLVPAGLVGKYKMRFTAPGLVAVTQSDSITLTKGAAAKLVLLTEPSTTSGSGQVLAQQPKLMVQDVGGNPVSGARTISAAISALTPSNGTVIAGGTASTGAADSVAAFTALKLTGIAGSYRLVFVSAPLTPDTATSATVLGGAGTASRMVLDTAPSTGAPQGTALPRVPVIRLKDAFGAEVSLAGVQVTTVLTGASMSGSVVATDATGKARFGSLAILSMPSPFTGTLRFAAAGLDTVASPTPTTLASSITNGGTFGISGATNSETYRVISVPAGQSLLKVETLGGSGDANIYVRMTDVPGRVAGSYEQASQTTGTSTELISIPNPPAGYYFIQIFGATSYSTTLRATITP